MLNQEDFDFLADTSFLEAKKRITKEIISVLAQTEEKLKSLIAESSFEFPNRTFAKTGKISKGENYKDLPYFILDFPRKFSKKSTFAFRTMIWWGNEISFTLHLGGDVASYYAQTLLDNSDQLKNYYICINRDPWEYDFNPSNYVYVADLPQNELKKIIEEKDFIKISRPFPLPKIYDLPELACSHLSLYLELLRRY